MAKIKSDAHLWLTETGDTAAAAIGIASITNTKPSILTGSVALPAGVAVGDFVKISGTSEVLLDGHTFRIEALDVSTPSSPEVTLYGLDGAKLGAAVGAIANGAQFFQKAGTVGLLEVCLVNITVAGVAPDSIALDDMCGSSTVLGSPKPPTFTYSGFVDAESPGYRNLVQASLESPKQLRYMLVDYTVGGGYIFGPVEIGEITITAQTAQGLQFSGSGVFTEMPTYSWALAA